MRSGPGGLKPVVSVVVSTRNHAPTLGRTVEAVMSQDLDAELEMIVVDNASEDGTEAVMESRCSVPPARSLTCDCPLTAVLPVAAT